MFGTTRFAAATLGNTVRVGFDLGFPHCRQLTPSLFPFEFHQEFDTHIRKIFCLMAAVSRSESSDK